MAISLQKGSSFNLTKKEPALKKIMIGLGWEMTQGQKLDLDASVFMLASNGKLVGEEYFVFFNNLKSGDGSVQHTGDNRTGAGDEDDEMILVNLPIVNSAVKDILVTVSIHEAAARRHSFGLLQNAYIRIVDVETKREVLRYDLDAEFGNNTDVEFGKLHNENGEWHFTAVGVGSNKGLEGYVNAFA
ncbi:tellurium resistance protein TerD [Flexibacter flexilis DSM 6793]|uniref:Tellurium resistance protein TerD n=1 Tax=Flexibacter flexilis DSM 6793 TaxID=927664 RepID=A0A1I1NAP1_9BACT|nr:TerD family protein [Flexibacter flexilis]SFC90800.1 tellurium resistance protein TerD [Flexibacter flexilis DSM 6793]